MQDSLNHNISQKNWGIKLNFWIWLEVRERDVVTLWLIGGTLTQTGCNEKPCSPKIFKANQIAWFFYTKFKHHDQHQNQHHDCNLLNKFWLLTTFGVLFKVSCRVKLVSFSKFKVLFFHQYADMCDRNVNPKVTCKLYLFLIHVLLFIIFYILFQLQMPDKKICSGFCLFLHILKCNYWQA